MTRFNTLAPKRNRLPSLATLGQFAVLVGLFVLLYFMIAFSMQRSNVPVVLLTHESAVDLASAF